MEPIGGPPRSTREHRFRALLDAHGPALGRLAGSYARTSGERDDLFQDIALAIWRALPGFRGECSERTFVFRIAHNRGLSHVARTRPPIQDLDEIEPADAGPNPEQAMSLAQQGQALVAAVRDLPIGYREVVTLALEGLAYREIAEVLGISESNVGARLTRAREMLRRSMT